MFKAYVNKCDVCVRLCVSEKQRAAVNVRTPSGYIFFCISTAREGQICKYSNNKNNGNICIGNTIQMLKRKDKELQTYL